MRAWVRGNGAVIAGSATGSALAVYSTLGAWGGRPPAGEDVQAHLVRLDFGIAQLVAHGRLDGWLPRFYLGYQEFLFNGPGLAWAAGLVRGLTLGALSNTGALKIVGIASLAVLPPSVAFAARALGLSRPAAGIAAVLSLVVSNVFGPGLQGLYLVGLVPHQVAAPLFFLALGSVLRVPVDRRARWVVLGAISAAALAVTHLISLMVLAVVGPLCMPGLVRAGARKAGIGWLALTGALAMGLAGWWLVPVLAHRDLRGLVATWSTPPIGERVDDIVDGRILLRPYTILLVGAGCAYGLGRVWQRRPLALTLVLVPPGYLLVAHWAASSFEGNEVAVQLANRGLGYAGVLATLPLAALVAGVVYRLDAARVGHGLVTYGLALVGAGFLVLSPLGPDRDVVTEQAEPITPMREAAEILGRVVPDGARFTTQRDFPSEIARTGVIHPDTWLARESGVNSLSGFNLESTSTPVAFYESDELGRRPLEGSVATLAQLGVSHVVTTSPDLAESLSSSRRFRRVWESAPLAVFAVVPERGTRRASIVTGDGVSARLVHAAPERLRIEIDARSGTPVTVALAWSPKWHGEVDRRAVALGRTDDGLITVPVPAGRARLDLAYRTDVWDRIGVVVSALTLAGLAGWAARHARGRRVSRSSR